MKAKQHDTRHVKNLSIVSTSIERSDVTITAPCADWVVPKIFFSNCSINCFFFRPSDSEIEKSRKMKIREKMTGLVIKDIVTYLIFLLVVAKLAYSERDFHTYIYRKDMVNMLKDATYTGGPNFEQVINIPC